MKRHFVSGKKRQNGKEIWAEMKDRKKREDMEVI